MWAAGSRGSGSSELGIPPEISIYSDSGWDSSEPNVLLEECNYNEKQSSNIPHDARTSTSTSTSSLVAGRVCYLVLLQYCTVLCIQHIPTYVN